MSIGKVYWILDDYAAARDMLDRVEELVRSSRGAESHEMADAMNAVANVMCDDGRLTEALDKSLAAIRLCDRIGIGDEATRVIALTNVVVSLTELSRNNEALSWSETALATSRRTFKGDDDLTADALLNHALLLSRHAPAEALPLYEEALAMFERLYGTTRPHPHFVRCLTLLGECLASLGQTDEALPKYEAAVDVSRHLYKVPNRDTVQTLHILAEALRRRGRLPEAERYAREAVQTARAHPEWSMNEPRINGELFLAQVLFDAGRPDEAVASLRECVELVREQYPGHLLAQMCSLHILSWALLKRDGPRWAVEVERLMRESLTMYEELPPPEHAAYAWARANALRQLGAALTLQGRFSEAEPELLAAYEGLRSPDSGTPPPGRFDLDFKRDCMERIAILYERWHGAQPGAGYDRKAVHWRAALLPTIQSAQGEAR
jgi:tetratricopeptide (TPR) repeat protein